MGEIKFQSLENFLDLQGIFSRFLEEYLGLKGVLISF